MILQYFTVGDKEFVLTHNLDDDSRAIVNEDGETVMEISSSLRFTGPDGEIGDLVTEGDEGGGHWVFYYGPIRSRFDTGVFRDRPRRSYCWENLEHAEVEAAKRYISTNAPIPKIVNNFACTEGGSCD